MFRVLGLLFTALLLSAGSSISDACNDDPEQCTPGKLCEIATEQKHGKLIWSTQSKQADHVTYAQKVNLGCGAISPCDASPLECTINELCEKATSTYNDVTTWNDGAKDYVMLAWEYNLKCGVGDNESNKEKTTFMDVTTTKTVTPTSNKEIVKAVQRELNRLGCNAGIADGIVGGGSKRALRALSREIGAGYSNNRFYDTNFVEVLRKLPAGTCKVKSTSSAASKISGKYYACSLKGANSFLLHQNFVDKKYARGLEKIILTKDTIQYFNEVHRSTTTSETTWTWTRLLRYKYLTDLPATRKRAVHTVFLDKRNMVATLKLISYQWFGTLFYNCTAK